MSEDLRKPRSPNVITSPKFGQETDIINPFKTGVDLEPDLSVHPRRKSAHFLKEGDGLPEKLNPGGYDLDLHPEKEEPTRLEFQSDEFNDLYNEHVRRKEQIRQKMERLTREKQFLENLKVSDLVYIKQKEKEYKLKMDQEAFE